jgi:D-alanyl-lipoteichoic acid acyltransferase DltB (MBOAT superfamily)
MVVFLISGLWHGANWTFVAWGALHGVFTILGTTLKPLRKKTLETLKIDDKSFFLSTINTVFIFSLVTLCWVFFRAESFEKSGLILRKILQFRGEIFPSMDTLSSVHLNIKNLLIIIISLVIISIVHWVQRLNPGFTSIRVLPWYVRWVLYHGFIWGLALLGVYGQGQFIYFQF